jgi:hypothetical protein
MSSNPARMSSCLEIAGGNRSHGTITKHFTWVYRHSSLLVTKKTKKKGENCITPSPTTKEAVELNCIQKEQI